MSTVENLDLLTVAEAASILRISRATAYRLVESGELPAVKVGGSIRVGREALLDTLAFRVPDQESGQ